MNTMKFVFMLSIICSSLTSIGQNHHEHHDDEIVVKELSNRELVASTSSAKNEAGSVISINLTNVTDEDWEDVTIVCRFEDGSTYLPQTLLVQQNGASLPNGVLIGNVFGPNYLELTFKTLAVKQQLSLVFDCLKEDGTPLEATWYIQFRKDDLLHQEFIHSSTSKIAY